MYGERFLQFWGGDLGVEARMRPTGKMTWVSSAPLVITFAASRGVPVTEMYCCNVRDGVRNGGLWIGLDGGVYAGWGDEVGVPCAVRHFDVLVSVFFPCWLSKDVATRLTISNVISYFELKRPTGTWRLWRNETCYEQELWIWSGWKKEGGGDGDDNSVGWVRVLIIRLVCRVDFNVSSVQQYLFTALTYRPPLSSQYPAVQTKIFHDGIDPRFLTCKPESY